MAIQDAISRLTLNGAALEDFKATLRGELLRPEDSGYEEARHIWNGMIDRHPALIVRCEGAADVMSAVTFARDHDLTVSVRGGGHNVAGTAICAGGLVIDLSNMRGVRVDPDRRRVRVEGGARLGDIDHEAQAFGLAVPAGVVSRTGIAGLALHGGMGLLTRKYGLTSDNLVSADVVAADGRLLTVDEEHHPDLLWALRGGGGNFGVVTSFEFRAYPVGPEVWMAIVFYPVEKAQTVVSFFRDFMITAPDDISALAIFWNALDEEHIPEAFRGEPVIVLAACYSGALEEGERALQPLREVANPIADLSGPLPFLAAQQIFDPDYPDGRRYYWKSLYLDHLGEEVIEALAGHAARRPSPLTSLDVWSMGGAAGRIPAEATAFGRRDILFLIGIEANWNEPEADEANIAWAREVFRDMQRFSPGGAYLNFPGFGEDAETLVRTSFAGNYPRLQAIKATYDPDNFFHHTLNIAPERL